MARRTMVTVAAIILVVAVAAIVAIVWPSQSGGGDSGVTTTTTSPPPTTTVTTTSPPTTTTTATTTATTTPSASFGASLVGERPGAIYDGEYQPTVEVWNVGEATGETEVSVTVDRREADVYVETATTTLTLGPNETTRWNPTIGLHATGTYDVYVGGSHAGTIDVRGIGNDYHVSVIELPDSNATASGSGRSVAE